MPNIKISQLPVLANPVDATKIPVVDSGGTKTISASSLATYVSGKIPWDSVLPTATTSVLGGVKVDGSTIVISGTGVISSQGGYSLPTASTTVTGGVRVDGTSITIAGGIITASSLVNGVHTLSLGSTGNTTFPTGLTLGAPRGVNTVNFTCSVDKEFQIETGTASAGRLWQFGTAGNTTFPSGLTLHRLSTPYSNITADLDKILQIATQTSGGRKEWTFGTNGSLTFPDGYLKVVPNGANPYISNRTDNGLGLVSGSAVQIRQSVADAYGITIDSSTTDTSLGGGALLASGSAIDVNGSKIIIGQYTVNNLDATTGLSVQNKIEINNTAILIGQYVSTLTSGTTTSAFSGWTFGTNGAVSTTKPLGINVPNGVPTGVGAITSTSGQWNLNPLSNLATTGGSGSGLTVNVTQTGGSASAIAIATAGTGYLNGELITVTSGGSSASFTIAVTGTRSWTFGVDGKLTAPGNLQVNGGKLILNSGGNAYVESVDYGVNSANSAVNIFGGPYQKINLRAGFGTQATWTLATDGSLTFPNATVQTTAYLGTASTTQIGGVLVPAVGTSGINNTTGTIGLATASNSQLGGVRVDASSITIDASGIISVPAVATIGLANGIATLGMEGKLTAGQIPSSVVVTGGSYSDPSWLTLTASKVGLGNVTNESKATMFASPTFTGTVAGVTATHVGLGNVTNESKATMFASPTFTGLITTQQSTEVYAVKSGTGGSGDYDFSTASIWLVNVDSVGQFAINFTNVPTTINRTTVVTLILQQGTTPYGPSSFSIAGAAQTIKWIGGATPTFGSNRYEILSFTLIRLANASWGAVLGSLSSFS